MSAPRSYLTSIMDDRIAKASGRQVWTPSDFTDLGGRDAVDKALQRRAHQGVLRRIDRGLYDKPKLNSLTKKLNPPDPAAVIDAVARRDHIRLLVDGMTAANDLGLTNAVPAKIVVHADARLRPIQLGQLAITFRPTAASKLFWAGRPAMRLVQALHWLRDTFDQDEIGQDYSRRVAKLLQDPKAGPAMRKDLAEGFSALPSWMQDLIRPHLADALTEQAIAP
ncbi:DUF6088 family protein [Caulobacter sp.]|uniref:DUF6088 family protein n=1 Tax=Caulobacter sp. TaxID=78 RepID=UPI0031D943B7